ncbi:hypothetical protein LCGC14_2652170 [marine sediment metagenome]|uniref:AB hydrolase-1 domain-containing protein n=1 Tax=marine sediment metagenome TaxID=412755 RepID=A0A0F9CLJ0_9ZZZZ
MTESVGISLYDKKLWHIGNAGIGPCFGHDSIRLDLSTGTVIMIHGFRYDPKSHGDNNPHLSTFEHWRKNIIKTTSAFGFGWWSCPGKWMLPRSLLKAFLAGRWNTYRYAWDLAEDAGRELAKIIAQFPKPVTLLCHSLGSRVVLGAIESDLALPINRVVIMNGAELRKTAVRIVRKRPRIRFFNLVVEEDDVLKRFGERFVPEKGVCIGRVGLGIEAPQNWSDLNLDSLAFKVWARSQGWPNVEGDNPKGYFDHWWTHKHEGNWPLIHALLMQGDISPPRP